MLFFCFKFCRRESFKRTKRGVVSSLLSHQIRIRSHVTTRQTANIDCKVRPNSLVDGEWFGLEDDEVRGLGGIEVLEDETPLGECAPILLTLVFGEEGHLWWGVLVSLGNP